MVVHVASEANLAEITGRASEAVCPAYLASSKFVALVVLRSYRRLRNKSFAYAAEPSESDLNESPKAKSTRRPLLRRGLDGWLFVFCMLEAGRFAHMRMIVNVAEPDVGGEVLGISCGVGFEVFFRSNGAINFATTDHFAIPISHIDGRSIYPAGLSITTVL